MTAPRRSRSGVPPSDIGTPQPRSTLPPGCDILLVAVGGALGATARVALAQLFPTAADSFPWTTFVENVAGAFVLALLLTWLAERARPHPKVRLTVGTGALGAFTTYSVLATETLDRLLRDDLLLGAGYATASVVCGLLAALLGARLSRHLSPVPAKQRL